MIRIFATLAIWLALSAMAEAQQARGISPCVQSGSVPTTLAVTVTSANVQASTCGPTLIIMNITSQEAFINIGSASNTAATTSGWSVPGNSYVVIQVPTGGTAGWYLAAITGSSTTTLRLIQGWGY